MGCIKMKKKTKREHFAKFVQRGKLIRENERHPEYESGEYICAFGPQCDQWMNEIKIFASRHLTDHPLFDDIQDVILNHNNRPSAYEDMMGYLRAILDDEEFWEEIEAGEKKSRNTVKASKSNALKQERIIFLSHKSDDKKYGDALRDFIIGLGVKDEQLIYTSHPLNKIPMDENIYEYLRKNINSQVFMIILWSDAYLDSPACLNEMGAAWVTQADYTNIYVPDFSFGNPKYHECAVDTRKMGAVLNGDEHCKASMIEFKNKIVDMFELEDNETKTNYLIDKFIESINDEGFDIIDGGTFGDHTEIVNKQ